MGLGHLELFAVSSVRREFERSRVIINVEYKYKSLKKTIS